METKPLESLDLILGEEDGQDNIRLDFDLNGVSFCVNVKTALSIEERFTFIRFVVENCFVDGMDLSCYRDRAFCVAFWQIMTDLPVPMKFNEQYEKEVVDVAKIEKASRIMAFNQRCKQEPCLAELIGSLQRDVDTAIQRAFLESLFRIENQ